MPARSPPRSSCSASSTTRPWAHLDIAGTGDGLAADRDQQELGLGLRRAPARPAGGGSLRSQDDSAETPMTEVLFYHLQRQPLEDVLPPLLEKSLERGWRVVVQSDVGRARRCARRPSVDLSRRRSCRTALARRDARDQPIVLAVEEDNPNGANVRFLIDSAALPRTRTPMIGWCWSSTATTTTRWRLRGAPGPTARRGGSRLPIGRPTSGAGGSGGNSNVRQLMIICVFGPCAWTKPRSCRKGMLGQALKRRRGELVYRATQ